MKTVSQRNIGLIERMPNVPQPFLMIDWKMRARGFDRLAFDLDAKGEHLPLVKLVDDPFNIEPPAFALPSYVGVPLHRGEAITCLAAVMSSTLVGIDMRDQRGRNWVRMCTEWFNAKNGQRVVLNDPTGRTGDSFWYEVFPGMLFCHLADRYAGVEGMDAMMRAEADRWVEACDELAGKDGWVDFNWTAFNFAPMEPVFNGRWREPDAAAGIGWIEFMAWTKWRDACHLRAAESCMDFLQRRTAEEGNPLYEVLLYYAPVLAARMNAELGRRYDVDKLVDWCFSENRQKGATRDGWGIIADRFGSYDCHGLQGSTLDTKGYAFAMNTFAAAAAVAPLARYDTRYARAIGKWLLNVANNARLFYPDALPVEWQSSPYWESNPPNVVAYEGLRRFAMIQSRLVREETIRGRVEQDGDGDSVSAQKPVVFVADEKGRLEHVWQFELPHDATFAPFWTLVRGDALPGTFVLEGGYDASGPWQTLLKFSPDGAKAEVVVGLGAVMLKPQGHNRIWLRLRSRSGTTAGARLGIEQLHCRIQLPCSPFAMGDPLLNNSAAKTDLGVYGSAHVGYLAALVERTNRSHILQIDLLATDFFHGPAYPTYLYFNPDPEPKRVRIKLGDKARDLYDTVAGDFVVRSVHGATEFEVPPDSARVIVVAPAGGKLSYDGNRTLIDGVVVDYNNDGTKVPSSIPGDPGTGGRALKRVVMGAMVALGLGLPQAALAEETPFVPFVYAAEGAAKILVYDRGGKVSWEYPAPMSRDVWRLPSGNTLFCYNQNYKARENDNASGVMEVTPDKRVVFEFKTTGQVFSCQRLANGNTVISGRTAVTEVDAANKTVWRLDAGEVPQLGVRWFAGVQVLPDGNLFICNAGGKVPFFEIRRDKRVVWQCDSSTTYPLGHGVQRLDVGDLAHANR